MHTSAGEQDVHRAELQALRLRLIRRLALIERQEYRVEERMAKIDAKLHSRAKSEDEEM